MLVGKVFALHYTSRDYWNSTRITKRALAKIH
jgi:hypothetical protein